MHMKKAAAFRRSERIGVWAGKELDSVSPQCSRLWYLINFGFHKKAGANPVIAQLGDQRGFQSAAGRPTTRATTSGRKRASNCSIRPGR